MIERPKSSHQSAIAKQPIVFVVEDDESVRRALANLFGPGLLIPNSVPPGSRCQGLAVVGSFNEFGAF